MNNPWYMAWWALNWEMWDNDGDEDTRPIEQQVIRNIRKQAQYAWLIRYAQMAMEAEDDHRLY